MVIHFSILAWRISLKEMSGCQGSRDGRVGHNCLQVWGVDFYSQLLGFASCPELIGPRFHVSWSCLHGVMGERGI